VLLGGLVFAVASFIYGVKVGDDAAESRFARAVAAIEKVEQRAERGAAREIAKIRVVNQHHRQVIEREVQKVPDGSCVLSDDGLRALNEILASGAEPARRGELPDAGAAR
jgi:hypothetical protein